MTLIFQNFQSAVQALKVWQGGTFQGIENIISNISGHNILWSKSPFNGFLAILISRNEKANGLHNKGTPLISTKTNPKDKINNLERKGNIIRVRIGHVILNGHRNRIYYISN